MPKQKIKTGGAFVDLASAGKVSFPLSAGGPILPPTFIASNHGYAAAPSNTISVNKPAGNVAGDLILLTFSGQASAALNTPSGFTALGGGAGSADRIAAFYKYSSGSEPASYSVSTGGALGGSLVCSIWRGSDVPIWGGAGGAGLTSPAYVADSGGKTVLGVFGRYGYDLSGMNPVAPWVLRQRADSELLISQDISTAGTYTPTITQGGGPDASHTATIILPGGGGNYTLQAADAGKVVDVSAINPANVTIPPNLFTVGDVIRVRQTGAAAVGLVAGAGVSISGATATATQGDELWLYMSANNSWSSKLIAVDPATQAELNAVIASLAAIDQNNQTGTTYTLALSDAGKVVELNNAAAITLTVPTNATVAFPIGTVIELWQQGAGQVTVAGAAGVTIRSTEAKLKLYGQYAAASLRKRATDEWVLVGDLVA